MHMYTHDDALAESTQPVGITDALNIRTCLALSLCALLARSRGSPLSDRAFYSKRDYVVVVVVMYSL